jgi:hypothetical protein
MKFKQALVTVLITVAFILPKELFFKPESFWMDMMLNVIGFMLGGVAGALLFMKKKDTSTLFDVTKTKPKEYIPAAPMPEATKQEDYNKYMPK